MELTPPAALQSGERHHAILVEAMALIAERGYAGASLRELARRVGVRQPSLYHYFADKQDLVGQVVSMYAAEMQAQITIGPPEMSLSEVLRRVAADARAVLATPGHRTFARFLLQVTLERPEFAPTFRALLIDPGRALFRRALVPSVARGELAPGLVDPLVRLVTNALGLESLHRHVLFLDAAVEGEVDMLEALFALSTLAPAPAPAPAPARTRSPETKP